MKLSTILLGSAIASVAVAAPLSKQELHTVIAKAWEAEQPQGWHYPQDAIALHKLAQRESSMNPAAQNPRSSAFGLFQFLNGTWAGTGIRKTSDPVMQTRAAIRYISGRYGTSRKAYRFQRSRGWY